MPENKKLKPAFAIGFALLVMCIALLRSGISVHADWHSAEFPNPDSYYKLVLLQDRAPDGGFSLVQRDNAPDGNWLHWSATHSWSVWQLHRPLVMAGVDQASALIWAGSGLTLLSMLTLAALVAWTIARIGSVRAAAVTGLMLACSLPLHGYGRLDQITHHVFMLVPLALAALMLLRAPASASITTQLFGGTLLGLALWTSPETMPLTVTLAGVGAAMRLEYAQSAPVWPIGLGLLLTLLAAWGVDPPPPTFSAWALDHVSFSWLLFALLGALLLGLVDVLSRVRRAVPFKLGVIAIAALMAAICWMLAVPNAASGPASLLPAELHPLFWDQVKELESADRPSRWIGFMTMPAIAGVLLAFVARRERSLWMLALALAALAYAGLAGWHLRMGAAAALIAALAFGVGASRLPAFADRVPPHLPMRDQLSALLLTLLGPILLLAAVGATVLQGDAKPSGKSCSLATVADALNQWPPATVLAPLFSGPELLYRSHHRTIAGPYHHNVQGMLDNFRAWLDTDDATAPEIIQRRGVKYVLGCTRIQHQLKTEPDPSLAQRVANGNVPEWLKPLPWPDGVETDWRLYQVESAVSATSRR